MSQCLCLIVTAIRQNVIIESLDNRKMIISQKFLSLHFSQGIFFKELALNLGCPLIPPNPFGIFETN